MKKRNRVITVKGATVIIATRHEQDYISLTDMLRNFGDEGILYNWLRNRNTIEFLGIWEQLYNSTTPLSTLSNSIGLRARQG